MFENMCAQYRQNIMSAKPCVSNHINEIELQTRCVDVFYFHCDIIYELKTNISDPIR